MARNRVILDSSDESQSESSASHTESSRSSRAALIDDEAQESSNASDSDNDDVSDLSGSVDEARFHQFLRLPPELRQRVWEFVCPDLENPEPRVLAIRPMINAPGSRSEARLVDDMWLQSQTEALRLVSSIHHESRNLVTQKYPNVFGISAGDYGDALIRFSAERDIVLVNDVDWSFDLVRQMPDELAHLAQIKNLASRGSSLSHLSDFVNSLRQTVDLDRLYILFDESELLDGEKRWAVTEFVHRYDAYHKEDIEGLSLVEHTRWTWPDIDKSPDFAKYHVLPAFRRDAPDDITEWISGSGLKRIPMIEWDIEDKYNRENSDTRVPVFTRLLREYQSGVPLNEGGETPDSGSDGLGGLSLTDSDTYESDGLDDEPIAEIESDDGDELLPGSVNSDDSSGVEATEPDAGRFSSPDVSSHEEDQLGLPRRPKRRIVDSSDEEDGMPAAKRVRTRPVVVVSDDEDVTEPKRGSTRSRARVISSDEDGSDPDNDDEEEAKPLARPLTLAERLANFREDNPTPGTRRRHRHRSTSSGEDGQSSVPDEDDDDEEEEEEEDNSEDEDGLIDGIASETEDDDGDGEDDGEEGW